MHFLDIFNLILHNKEKRNICDAYIKYKNKSFEKEFFARVWQKRWMIIFSKEFFYLWDMFGTGNILFIGTAFYVYILLRGIKKENMKKKCTLLQGRKTIDIKF